MNGDATCAVRPARRHEAVSCHHKPVTDRKKTAASLALAAERRTYGTVPGRLTPLTLGTLAFQTRMSGVVHKNRCADDTAPASAIDDSAADQVFARGTV